MTRKKTDLEVRPTVRLCNQGVYTNLFALHFAQGQYQEAEKAATEKLSYARRVFGERHPALVADLQNLGVLYREWGKYDEAEKAFERAIWMAESTMGARHPQLPLVLENYARLRRNQHLTYEAHKLRREARRLKKRQKKGRK